MPFLALVNPDGIAIGIADKRHVTHRSLNRSEIEFHLRRFQLGDGGVKIVNLERATKSDGRLGGHIMQGHVDGVATLVARDSQAEWDDLTFSLPSDLLRYVVRKGSIALNGVSLTVAELEGDLATVSLIPTTLSETTFGDYAVGDKANVEVDVIAKYVERMMGDKS